MEEQTRYPYRDPMAPGQPIIPRGEWDLPPYNRWTFQHIREMTATQQIWRGNGPVMQLETDLQDIGGLQFEGQDGTIDEFVERSFTDGFLIIHKGRIVRENYLNGMRPHGQHLAMSVTKSIVGLLTGILAGKGLVDPSAPVTDYLPELDATAYRGARVQHLLDMTSGTVFDESYTTPGSHMQKLDLACGWKERKRPGWPRTMWELVLELTEQEAEHGTRFNYRSIDTDVLGFVLERAGGRHLAELLSEEIWQPMGAAEDAYITVDNAGTALADGGFCACLRDFGRIAQLLVDGGRRGDRQIIPAGWIEETRSADHAKFGDNYRIAMPEGGYRNKFWIEDPKGRALVCRGVYGQFIYVDPEAGFAGVKLSSWPDYLVPGFTKETLAAFNAIKVALAG
ncbi:serine hydrolase [Aquamicrobium sp. LC103]|uniref:serine hydrolase domain-containing protein n=1 Tax=Aquamicrobium sp. LC103 TaxID=1120658 RepID=UPI00063E8198|nr:serine hydrolase [Aquamicrobium sp. LC103]TKT76174.1 serine hydrolase [Aquamicrobium sp. LC103]